jgi:tellurite methyltransferase
MHALDPAGARAARADHLLLDVRDPVAFEAGHLPDSGHVPLAELEPRRAELPPRDVAVMVVGDQGALAHAGAAELERLGYRRVAWLDAPLAEHGALTRGPAAPLWRPNAFLAEVLPQLPRGRAIDVAAGSGREAVLLAMHGFEVEAWDRAPEALARAAALAERHGARLTTVVRDLEWRGVELPVERYDLLVCFRFLHRPLFPAMARALRPGGHLVIETYRVGQERFGRPTHRRFLLEAGELPASFPGFEVLRHEEPEPAEGPITARLWARRPLAAGGDTR